MRHLSWDIQPRDFTWNVYIEFYDADDMTADHMLEYANHLKRSYLTKEMPDDVYSETWGDFQNAGMAHLYVKGIIDESGASIAFIMSNHRIPSDEIADIVIQLYEEYGGVFIQPFSNSDLLHTLRGSRESSQKLSWDLEGIPKPSSKTVEVKVNFPITEYWRETIRQYKTNYVSVKVPHNFLLLPDPIPIIRKWLLERQDDIDWYDIVDSEIDDTEYMDGDYIDSDPPILDHIDIHRHDLAEAITNAKNVEACLDTLGIQKTGWDTERYRPKTIA